MKIQQATIAQSNYSRVSTGFSTAFRSSNPDKNINDTAQNKTSNTPLKLLVGGLAIGALIFGGIKLHKPAQIKQTEKPLSDTEKLQNLCQTIFHREMTLDETKDFAKRYKTILEAKYDNDKMLCDRLIEEICKDRQTKKPRINLFLESQNQANPLCINGLMSTAPDGSYIDIYAFNYKNTPNPIKGYFEDLFHETHHVKQNEIIYRTDKDAFLEKLINRVVNNGNGKMYKNVLQTTNGDEAKAMNIIEERLRNQMNYYWGKFEPFAKDSPEYKEGQKLIKGSKEYKFFYNCKNQEEYEAQIIEKGAYTDGKNAAKIFDLLTSGKF